MDRSELILNKDGSVYHLKLKSENLSSTVILVGDPFRVDKITKHFDKIEFKTQNREFKSVTGYYKAKRKMVISFYLITKLKIQSCVLGSKIH